MMVLTWLLLLQFFGSFDGCFDDRAFAVGVVGRGA